MKLSRLVMFSMIATLGALTLAGFRSAMAQSPTPEERIAALKSSLIQSAQVLRTYEWIETTVVSVKGEEKSRTVNRCYYGADGKLQKVATTAPPPPKKKGLLGGNSAEKQAEYIRSAVELVKNYIPPDPARLDASKTAGKMSITPAGSSVRLDFRDYQKAGDMIGITVDMTKNKLMALNVDTWLKDAKDKVSLASKFGSLNDGSTYPEESTLSAPSQSIDVKVTNSGYKKQ